MAGIRFAAYCRGKWVDCTSVRSHVPSDSQGDRMNLPYIPRPRNASSWIALAMTLTTALVVLAV